MSAQPRISSIRTESLSQSALDQAFQDLANEADVLESLNGYAEHIKALRARNFPDERIADKLATVLNAKPESILAFLRSDRNDDESLGESEATESPSYRLAVVPRSYTPRATVAKGASTRRAKVPASEIRSAIEAVMAAKKITSFRLSDEKTVSAILDRVPSLVGLQKHQRNRKIIDACAQRKRGPVIVSNGGKREIALVA